LSRVQACSPADNAAAAQNSVNKLSLSVVLPAYNEEAVIGATVGAVVDFVSTLTDDYEVIVVNDGSRDRTPEIVRELSQENPAVRCVSHERNRGYGAALGTGFAAATRELVFLTDGDKQFDIRELSLFLPLIDEADLVIGYRHPRRDPFIRCLNGWGWNAIVNLLFGYTARDVDGAFKLFRRDVLDRVRVRATGATFSAEFLIKARRLGYRVVEHRVSHYPRPAGEPTGARINVIVRAFRELLWLRLNLERELARLAPANHASQPKA
jgi:glycosyltransferase involved in cell wall biosynthesis